MVPTPIRVGAVEHEEVREAADGDAEVGLRIVARPFVQLLTTLPDDFDTRQVATGLETCCQHDGVSVDGLTARGHYPAPFDPGDGIGHEFHVFELQYGEVVRAEQHALAAEWTVGCKCLAQKRIGHLSIEERLGQLLPVGHAGVICPQRGVDVLLDPQPLPFLLDGS
jgi:hypothetical protein